MTVGVLIVDDQVPFRRAAASVVGRLAGFEVVGEAGSGEEAVDLVDSLHPDLVLMDVNLPGMNGIEATRRITEAHRGLAVVLVSTYDEADLPGDFASCGALGYLHKTDVRPRPLTELWQLRFPPAAEGDGPP